MTNQYYNFIDPAQSGTIVDPFDYNREMEKVTAAFSVVPPASQLTSGTLNYSADTGTGNNHIATLDDFDPEYVPGNNVAVKINDASTGQTTLSVNGLAAKMVSLPVFGEVTTGDLFAEGVYTFAYNGERFQILEMGQRFYNTAFDQRTVALAKEGEAVASAATAATQATNATNSAGTATAQATAATNSANTAATQATAATTQANNATNSANTASQRESAAIGSASTAATQATNATASAATAAAQATNATNSANTAATQATAATTQANNAAASEAAAEAVVTDPGFNARVVAAILELELFPGCVEFFDSDIDPNVKYPGTTWTRLSASSSIRLSNATGSDVNTTTGSDNVTLTITQLPSHNHSVTPGTVSTTDIGSKTSSSTDLGTDTLANFTDSTKWTSTLAAKAYTSSSWDPGAISTNSAGNHSHSVSLGNNADVQSGRVGASDSAQSSTMSTGGGGAHTHSVNLGGHTHTVPVGSHNHGYALGSHTHTVAIGAHSHSLALGNHNHSTSTSITSVGSGTSFSVVESSLILVAWYRSA